MSNLSPPVQERADRDYCAREQLTVDRVFIERGESAKTTERSGFRKLLAYLPRPASTTDAVVVCEDTPIEHLEKAIRAFLLLVDKTITHIACAR